MMPGAGTLVLVLLTLCVELPPAPAQQQRAGDHGAAPAASPLPRRAPRGRRPPATPPAPGKAGECPAAGSGPLRPTRLYCLSDHSCPGAEKCCRRGEVRACLLPATESPGYCPRAGPSGASCGASCGNDTACGPAEKCCARSCCARCLPAEPAKPGLCPRKRARRGTVACPSRCADDRDCPGDRKCCFSGCGLACTSPHTGGCTAPPQCSSGCVAVPAGTLRQQCPELTVAPVQAPRWLHPRCGSRGLHVCPAKPGVCPVVLRGSLGPCEELCDTDGDCPGARKCCSTGCGHVCKPPTKAAGVGAGECLILCLEDKDCPPSQKCCLRDCGRACVPPLQGTA